VGTGGTDTPRTKSQDTYAAVAGHVRPAVGSVHSEKFIKIDRGQLGVGLQDLDKDLAKQFSLNTGPAGDHSTNNWPVASKL